MRVIIFNSRIIAVVVVVVLKYPQQWYRIKGGCLRLCYPPITHS
jgi:hypothetical protein